MSDITQGQDALSDSELFRDATESTTLNKFENPDPPVVDPPVVDKPTDAKPTDKPADKPTDKPADRPEQSDAAVPTGRLREESEARRRAEQERDVLRARLEAMQRQAPPQPQAQPQKVDIFDNPSGFVRQEIDPLIKAFQDELRQTREDISLDNAVNRHGEEAVAAARNALVQGVQIGDPNVKAVLDRAMASHDPYGVITKWHRERETIGKVGGDLDAYVKAQVEKLLDDPEHQKAVTERLRQSALANGQTVHRPAQSKVPTTPSLANIGAGGGDEQVQEPSDEALFRQVVSAKRR